MAAIREQLNNGTFEVTNQGNVTDFYFPDWMKISDNILNDEQALLEHCRKAGVLHTLLHTGLQQEVINCRAIARPTGKDGKALAYTDNIKVSIQKKLNERKPLPMPAPAEPKRTKAQILEAKWTDMEVVMRRNKLPDTMIESMKADFFK